MNSYNITKSQRVASTAIGLAVGLGLGYGLFVTLCTLAGRIAVALVTALVTGLTTYSIVRDFFVVSFDGKSAKPKPTVQIEEGK